MSPVIFDTDHCQFWLGQAEHSTWKPGQIAQIYGMVCSILMATAVSLCFSILNADIEFNIESGNSINVILLMCYLYLCCRLLLKHNGTLYVKQRAGHLSYVEDPKVIHCMTLVRKNVI
jgi:hypothetical protein